MQADVCVPTGVSFIAACGCCSRSTTVELIAVGNESRTVTKRPVCARCQREHGAAHATLIARARVEPVFAQRCMQNMSHAAAATFFLACGFKAEDLPKLQMSRGTRKCSPKPRLFATRSKNATAKS